MKATAPPAKRRRGPRLAVLALVFCSLLVPIAFLFNRFPAGESSASSPSRPHARRTPGFEGMQASARIESVPCHADLFLGALFPVLSCSVSY
jgi:hypothetical protein